MSHGARNSIHSAWLSQSLSRFVSHTPSPRPLLRLLASVWHVIHSCLSSTLHINDSPIQASPCTLPSAGRWQSAASRRKLIHRDGATRLAKHKTRLPTHAAPPIDPTANARGEIAPTPNPCRRHPSPPTASSSSEALRPLAQLVRSAQSVLPQVRVPNASTHLAIVAEARETGSDM